MDVAGRPGGPPRGRRTRRAGPRTPHLRRAAGRTRRYGCRRAAVAEVVGEQRGDVRLAGLLGFVQVEAVALDHAPRVSPKPGANCTVEGWLRVRSRTGDSSAWKAIAGPPRSRAIRVRTAARFPPAENPATPTPPRVDAELGVVLDHPEQRGIAVLGRGRIAVLGGQPVVDGDDDAADGPGVPAAERVVLGHAAQPEGAAVHDTPEHGEAGLRLNPRADSSGRGSHHRLPAPGGRPCGPARDRGR